LKIVGNAFVMQTAFFSVVTLLAVVCFWAAEASMASSQVSSKGWVIYKASILCRIPSPGSKAETRYVAIDYNDLKEMNSSSFQNLPKLKTFILRHNDLPVTTANDLKMILEEMPELDLLYLSGNHIKCKHVVSFLNATCKDK
jgi:hypothetical protein